jgi:hypothetical protein
MKKTKLTTIILAMALVSVFSITAIAASASNSNEAIKIGSTPGTGKIEFPGKSDNLRANRIGDMKDVIIDNALTRWDALTEEQKAELCDSNGRKAALTTEIIDKYLEFGIIDQATADAMKATLDRLAIFTETASADGDVSLGFSSLIYHFSPEEIANLFSFDADTASAGGDQIKGRIPGSYAPGHIYWNTAWNTAKGAGDIVAMP